MRTLDLFSGIGGFSLGLERAGMRTVQFVERDPYCQAVLAQRWPDVPCHGDIRSFHAPAGFADLIAGGFPCTDISTAGAKAGLDGDASGLWREFRRIIGDVRPRWVIVENVAALLYRWLGEVLRDLAALGYDAEWHCIPAAYVGAPIDREGRDRVWIVAYPHDRRLRGPRVSRELARELVGSPPWRDCTISGLSGATPDHGADQPAIPRVADGIPNRSHRIAAIGNAVCPPLVEVIGRAILEAERMT